MVIDFFQVVPPVDVSSAWERLQYLSRQILECESRLLSRDLADEDDDEISWRHRTQKAAKKYRREKLCLEAWLLANDESLAKKRAELEKRLDEESSTRQALDVIAKARKAQDVARNKVLQEAALKRKEEQKAEKRAAHGARIAKYLEECQAGDRILVDASLEGGFKDAEQCLRGAYALLRLIKGRLEFTEEEYAIYNLIREFLRSKGFEA